mmetsp:Transcript_55591/g.169075  ORF Transcript_55591/g.169075 Transcript_55591/m.169075 type:complete len:90 (+) Transcript_55591:1556-1825(+)
MDMYSLHELCVSVRRKGGLEGARDEDEIVVAGRHDEQDEATLWPRDLARGSRLASDGRPTTSVTSEHDVVAEGPVSPTTLGPSANCVCK